MGKLEELKAELKKVVSNYNVMIVHQTAEGVNAGLKLKQLKGELEREIDEIENPDRSKELNPARQEVVYKIFGLPIFSRAVILDEDAIFQRMLYLFKKEIRRDVDAEKNKLVNRQ